MPLYPVSGTRLVGSKWTCHKLEAGDDRPTHYEVIAYCSQTAECRMRSIRGRRELSIPWRQLRDREVWTPGWRSGMQRHVSAG